jgi:hypothetical protein
VVCEPFAVGEVDQRQLLAVARERLRRRARQAVVRLVGELVEGRPGTRRGGAARRHPGVRGRMRAQ